jgi:cellulose synthase/poly-beta-1,6-N-acetylglucosamine synthase-like glycosyltransferase
MKPTLLRSDWVQSTYSFGLMICFICVARVIGRHDPTDILLLSLYQFLLGAVLATQLTFIKSNVPTIPMYLVVILGFELTWDRDNQLHIANVIMFQMFSLLLWTFARRLRTANWKWPILSLAPVTAIMLLISTNWEPAFLTIAGIVPALATFICPIGLLLWQRQHGALFEVQFQRAQQEVN